MKEIKKRHIPKRVKVWALRYTKKQYKKAETFLIEGSGEEQENGKLFFTILEENRTGITRERVTEFLELKKYLDKP